MRKSLRKPIDGATPAESEFSFTLARIAVSQICQSIGYKGAQSPALEALTDITTRYLKTIAKVAAAAANSNGRTQSNLHDIICALEDLASVQGFPGSSGVRSHSLYSSAVIKDLMKFVQYADEVPFAQPLPPRRNFSQGAKGKRLKYGNDGENRGLYCNEGSLRHVPRWLPAVPVVQEMGKGKEKKREVKWGCLDDREERRERFLGRGEQKTKAEKESSNRIEVSNKRGRVRFKMGMVENLKGVGIRKRVCCEGLSWGKGTAAEEEDNFNCREGAHQDQAYGEEDQVCYNFNVES